MSDRYLIKWTRGRSDISNSAVDENQTTVVADFGNSSKTEDLFLDGKLPNLANSSMIGVELYQMYYVVFLSSSWVSFLLCCITLAIFMSLASHNLHRKILPVVMAAKMRFFDSQPIGRILNRFSRDFGIIDSSLQFKIWMCSTLGVQMVVFLGTICFTNAWMTFAFFPFFVALYAVSHVAIQTLRQLKRLSAVARSPIFSLITDTLAGRPTIRSSKLCDDFINKFNRHKNVQSAAYFMVKGSERGYDFVCLTMLWIYLLAAVFTSIFMKEGLSGDMVGLSLIYLITFAGAFQALMRSFCNVETQMTSVERVLAYTKLKSESPKISTTPPPSDWPRHGEIILHDVNMKYHEDGPLVLKNINLRINGKEKVGVVGRTGAGKSSLVTLLFRLAEQTGEMYIDSIDVTQIGLHELRKKISVLHQDPILFAGSLRYNLDMFSERSDEEIWEALREVSLKEAVEKLPGQLYTELSEDGNNFSVGERQLLCLARTILKHNRILILDEATANVDYRTDNIIQETVRRKFTDCTVITVAHRLQTIMDSDRIMVLDDGEVREFNTPSKLLREEGSIFKRLVKQSGMSSL